MSEAAEITDETVNQIIGEILKLDGPMTAAESDVQLDAQLRAWRAANGTPLFRVGVTDMDRAERVAQGIELVRSLMVEQLPSMVMRLSEIAQTGRHVDAIKATELIMRYVMQPPAQQVSVNSTSVSVSADLDLAALDNLRARVVDGSARSATEQNGRTTER